MPAPAWSCLSFASHRLTLPIRPERSPFRGRPPLTTRSQKDSPADVPWKLTSPEWLDMLDLQGEETRLW
jgi:hypothetical protein